MTEPDEREDAASVDLFWLPLGAGQAGRCVRGSGRLYEILAATRHRRLRADLYHSALLVRSDGQSFAIEMAPSWATSSPERGVVAQGAVGLPAWGRSRFFRYEVRRWRDGTIPDLSAAVDSPRRVSTDEVVARRVLALVASFPTATWGRDEQRTGDMWNSNSLTAWLLSRSGIDPAAPSLRPPDGGRAPGWSAGLVVAARADAQLASAVQDEAGHGHGRASPATRSRSSGPSRSGSARNTVLTPASNSRA